MDPLILEYDSADYDLIVELETVSKIDNLKYKLKIIRSHKEYPLTSEEYYLSEKQLDSILNYIMENK